MKRFANKVCLVTASTKGMGFSIAKRMAQEGGHVYICSRKEENVKDALTELRFYNVEGYTCDMGKEKQRLQLFDQIRSKH